MPEERQRWYAVKIFERDQKVLEQLGLNEETIAHMEKDIVTAERELDDDAESIITNERYEYITKLTQKYYKKKNAGRLSVSDKIDRILTNRILAIPIFVLVMFGVYALSIGTIGSMSVDFMNDVLFGEWIIPSVAQWLTNIGCAPWLVSLVSDGIMGGVGAVLGFVPQMLILFFMLCILEDCGYMSRVAFILDKLFRKFGLSGKSFIPLLVSSGCTVPGIMSTRTIEQERDRKITIMTAGFIPCGAKTPIIGMIAGSLFGGSAWIATAAYFMGIASVAVSGIILKKTKIFSGKPAPFVMELPAYHAPVPSNVFRTTWDRGWSFIKKAGTVILASSIVIWILNSLTFEGGFHYIGDGSEMSILNVIGGFLSYLFIPLGFGKWEAAVATILGLAAKEEVVSVFGSLSSMANAESAFALIFEGSKLSAFSFMMFNLLCAPCVATMGAIKREMNSAKWTFGAIGYMTLFAYCASLITYQLGVFFTGGSFNIFTGVALVVLTILLYLLMRKNKYGNE